MKKDKNAKNVNYPV